ncbi:uncharacterized protein V1516DRAFT_677553 [Lipomyces oligophaga]|uniref:uncharacterized protein n=1 Tax=Lipomyces oligophaga TaxID=45792 RepID=UPI0034CEF22D
MAGQIYHIAGRAFKPHQLAIATLSLGAFVAVAATSGKKPEEATTLPPINASSPEEEDFVKTFLKSLDAEEPKPAAH